MTRKLYTGRALFAFLPLLMISSAAQATLANRVFVSARSGNDANSCSSVTTPCQTFAGAVAQVNAGGEVIVLDSGGYGSVTITKSLTIEAPAGVTAFIHPPSGNAITVNASGATVTLRGLVLNDGPSSNGITVTTVNTLNVDRCTIVGFLNGIATTYCGWLNVTSSVITGCDTGISLTSNSAIVSFAAIDHCHLDSNGLGFNSISTGSGYWTTVATNSTANNNIFAGWYCGGGSGADGLVLESCTVSGNGNSGIIGAGPNAQTTIAFSNCVISGNEGYGVSQLGAATVSSRGNNTLVRNQTPTAGTIGSFLSR